MAKTKNNKYLKHKNDKKYVKPNEHQIETWLSKHLDYKNFSNQFRICNPDGDTKFCMEISKSEALVHDFRPDHQQYDGSFLGFVAKYKSISFREAIKEVCGNKIHATPSKIEQEEEELEHDIELPKGSRPLRDKNDSMLWKMNMGYLVKDRGLNLDVIFRADIHYLGTEIVVPYYQYGILVFYQSRKQLDKVFNFPRSSNKSAGDFLYGFDDVEPCGTVMIVESIFNSLSIGDGSVATGGAALKDGQIKLLKALNPNTVILAYDNDSAGRKATLKDYTALNKHKKGDLFKNIFYCLPPYHKDPKKQLDWNDMKQDGMNPKKYIMNNMLKMSMKIVFEGIDGKLFN